MRIISALLFIFCTVPYRIEAQDLTFYGIKVDTVMITYSGGVYQFDQERLSGVNDTFSIAFIAEKNAYEAIGCRRLKFKEYIYKKSESRYKHQSIRWAPKIDTALLRELLTSLTVKYIKPDYRQLGITSKIFNQRTNRNHIRYSIGKRLYNRQFRSKYSIKEENKRAYAAFRSLDTFNIYFQSLFDTLRGYAETYDLWIDFKIHVLCGNKKYVYSEQNEMWFLTKGQAANMPAAIVNVNIWRQVRTLLPRKFFRHSTINWTIENHIRWFFKRSMYYDWDPHKQG